ncbi:hypothetical protein MNV49_000488 [Pseudohyphozyma bogoriensis]|nr:hypothetical protein MNV49_000488 [Pseudohyphozyma bogoriensis]
MEMHVDNLEKALTFKKAESVKSPPLSPTEFPLEDELDNVTMSDTSGSSDLTIAIATEMWVANTAPRIFGNLFSTLLSGVVFMQMISFFTASAGKFPARRFDYWVVGLLALFCTLQIALDWVAVYQLAVVHSGEVLYPMRWYWNDFLLIPVAGVIAVVSQTWFLDRAWRLTGKNMTFFCVATLLMTASFATSWSIFILSCSWPADWPLFVLVSELFVAFLWITAATDVLLTAVLLWKVRELSQANRSDFSSRGMVKHIVQLSFATGSITSLIALSGGAVYLATWRDTNAFYPFVDALPRLSALSCVVTLNVRRQWRRESGGVIQSPSGPLVATTSPDFNKQSSFTLPASLHVLRSSMLAASNRHDMESGSVDDLEKALKFPQRESQLLSLDELEEEGVLFMNMVVFWTDDEGPPRRRVEKWLVGILAVLSAMGVALDWLGSYELAVTHSGDPTYPMFWCWNDYVLIPNASLITIVSELWFFERAWKLTGKNKYYLGVTLFTMAISLSTSMALFIISQTWSDTNGYTNDKYAATMEALLVTFLWSTALVDAMTTSVLIWKVRALARKNATIFSAAGLVSNIIQLSFATGALTAIIALACGVVYHTTWELGNMFYPLSDFLPRCSAISCLITLNLRRKWRRQSGGVVVSPPAGAFSPTLATRPSQTFEVGLQSSRQAVRSIKFADTVNGSPNPHVSEIGSVGDLERALKYFQNESMEGRGVSPMVASTASNDESDFFPPPSRNSRGRRLHSGVFVTAKVSRHVEGP